VARAKLAQLRAQRQDNQSTSWIGLLDYCQRLSPQLHRFDYFQPYVDALERAVGGSLRIAFAAPPQHGKSSLTLHAFLWWALFHPGKRHAYITYNGKRANQVAKDFIKLADAAGFAPGGTLSMVELAFGTTVMFTSVKGALTGYPIDGVCVIDDPIEDYRSACSVIVRQDCIDWWKSNARTRRHPGTSYIVMATRWHVSDLTGYLTKEENFRYINLKAIAEPEHSEDVDALGRVISDPLGRKEGEQLAAWKSKEFLAEDRGKNEYFWAAQFQGTPVALGSQLFVMPGEHDLAGNPAGPTYYKSLPTSGYRGAYGLDLAYTAKTSADWSIIIEGIAHGDKLYIVDVVRKQVDAPSFTLTLKAKQAKNPGWPMRWYAGGTEKGAADFIKRQNIRLKVLPPIGDKRVRAISVSAKWNAGDVLLPDPDIIDAPWLMPFLDVVTNFTGTGDAVDDDVDALSALHDQLFPRSKMFQALMGRK
jgi:predicted phage terminase large subunit-like protein